MRQYNDWRERGLRAVSPLAVQMYMPNAPAAAVGLERHAKAGIISPVMADASGAAAIAEAWRHIVLGEADIAICGGVETRIEAVPVAAFMQLGLLSTNNDDPAGACRPFDKDRDGMVFGEGGALMLIETERTRQGARRPHPGSGDGGGHHVRQLRHRQARPRRGAGRRRHHPCHRVGRPDACRHRPHQRPRHRNHLR